MNLKSSVEGFFIAVEELGIKSEFPMFVYLLNFYATHFAKVSLVLFNRINPLNLMNLDGIKLQCFLFFLTRVLVTLILV